MKRIAMLAAALAAGCVSSAPPPIYYGDVIVYWDFSRNTLVAPYSVLYDSGTPTNLSGPCLESGVEKVQIFDTFGNPQAGMTDCVIYNPQYAIGVQGLTILGYASGNYAFEVRGYRNISGLLVEVHRGQGSVYVSPDTVTPVTITAVGLQNNLDVYLYEGAPLFACLGGDSLGYTLVDGKVPPTTIDQISGLACGNPISFRMPGTGVDLDNLDIRVQVSNSGSVVLDSCVSQPFNHFGNDTGNFGWAVALYTTPCP